MSFHSINGNYELHAVDGLLIDTHRHLAWIRVNGKDYAILNDRDGIFQKMKIDSIKEMRLVCAESIEAILSRLAPILITMRMITEDIKASFSGRTIHLKKFDFNRENGGYHTVDLKLDEYLLQNRHDAVVWYCDNVNWEQIAPLLSLVRVELNYIYAAIRMVATTVLMHK